MRELEAHTANTLQTELRPFVEADIATEATEADFSDPAGLIDLAEYVYAVPPAASTVSLTNSPGCAPAGSSIERERNEAKGERRVRPMRTVRVDAWAAPASASWSRPRTKLRKVNSSRLRSTSQASAARSTNWALPF